MSGRLPVVTGRQVVRALERLGFVALRQRGSHLVLGKGDRRVVVPLHTGDDLKPGTLGTILKNAGITADELRALL